MLFLLLARKKAKTAKLKQIKSTSKKRNKCQKNTDGQIHFSPFFPFLIFLFSPFILLLCFWDFADLLFFGFCRTFFPVLKKIRISYGLVDIILAPLGPQLGAILGAMLAHLGAMLALLAHLGAMLGQLPRLLGLMLGRVDPP